MFVNEKKTLTASADKAEMDVKTARKYLKSGRLPSQMKSAHNWRTRKDPFESVWDEVVNFFENPGLEAKTVFDHLQRKYPGRFQDGQLRTFQRKVKSWKAQHGPSKEVYFPQVHKPGDLSSSDFTHMDDLEITINGSLFSHLIYHFVLTYSNWETGTICFSENFESLSEGMQNGFWQCGGVTRRHKTDNLSAAVYNDLSRREFTTRYQSLLNHYHVEGLRINPGRANENGDVEQSHHRLKRALDQALILRGSRDFASREEYQVFLDKLFCQLNAGRRDRYEAEHSRLRRLPRLRLDDYKKLKAKVAPSSTISVCRNVYSVHSRLIGERVEVRLHSEFIEVWYGQKMVEKMPRLRGEKHHHIQYRHIIDWLVRKPGAFENYRYKDDLFPTIRFRMAYDHLRKEKPGSSSKEYLQILHEAAREMETEVDYALRTLFDSGRAISAADVKALVAENQKENRSTEFIREVVVEDVDLSGYDRLLPSSSLSWPLSSPLPLQQEVGHVHGQSHCCQ